MKMGKNAAATGGMHSNASVPLTRFELDLWQAGSSVLPAEQLQGGQLALKANDFLLQILLGVPGDGQGSMPTA